MPVVAGLFLAVPSALAGDNPVSEYELTSQQVPPGIVFLVDLSRDMNEPCFEGSETACIDDVASIIQQVALHYDDLRIGVMGTSNDDKNDTYQKLLPVGTDYGDIVSALERLTPFDTDTRNFAESLSRLSRDYLRRSTPEDWTDEDGDGYRGDWSESPFDQSCTTVHAILLAAGRPDGDDDVRWWYASRLPTTNVRCEVDGEDECRLDDVAMHVYTRDHSSFAGIQNLAVSVVGLGLDLDDQDDATADELFANVAAVQDGDAVYTLAQSHDEAVAGVLDVLGEVVSGSYVRSTPLVAESGATLVTTYFEVEGDTPLARGHVRAFDVDVDPISSAYGSIVYNTGAPYDDWDGARWDAGWLLYEREASGGEANEDDRDGLGTRDIYFYDAALTDAMPSDAEEHRMSFDAEFVSAASRLGLLGRYLDDTALSSGRAADEAYNLDQSSDGRVDATDLQTLVDFTRGVESARFRYLDTERGPWKLGDAPYSLPVAVTRDMSHSASTSHRDFEAFLEAAGVPDVVLATANDGMLHAFRLDDDAASTSLDESGRELWAWIPSSLLKLDRSTNWQGALVDALWYGRTWMLDATPVVQDVWIDADNDGERDCIDLDSCEWRRVVVVQQGFGGPATLALDITRTDAPAFLWETSDEVDPDAGGYTTSRPAIFSVRDDDARADHWVAMWAGGRPANFDDGQTDYRSSSEARLYLHALGDDAFSGGVNEVGFSTGGSGPAAAHPDYARRSELDLDGDGELEQSYISAPPAVVDLDGDGAADVAYFPLTLAYNPDSSSTAVTSARQSFIYKALFNPDKPGEPEWCAFYDPRVGAANVDNPYATAAYGRRPEVYYSLTTAWLGDGGLGVYFGTGSPMLSDDSSEAGAFFFLRDPDPSGCAPAQALSCGEQVGGFYSLAPGERLTNDPLAHAGVVYFTTYTPSADECSVGTGRLYGLDFRDCSPGIDTDGDGLASGADHDHVETSGYLSNVAAGAHGTLFYSAGADAPVQSIEAVNDPFHGTALVAWMEVY